MNFTPSAAAASRKDKCVFLSFPSRKPDMSYDAFFRYWKDVHGPLHAGLDFVKANVYRYEHIYKDMSKSDQLAQTVGFRPLPYDGMMLHEATSYEKLAIWSDSASSAKSTTDRANFISSEAAVLGQTMSFLDKTKESTSGSRIRLVACIKRRPDLSSEAFQRHWGEVHSKLYTNLDVVKKNILLYEQIHVDRAATAALAAKLGFTDPGYDGILIQEAESYENIFRVVMDPEFLSTVVQDDEHFLDKESVVLLPGTFTNFI